jgi:uncharacterized low-complexity protein
MSEKLKTYTRCRRFALGATVAGGLALSPLGAAQAESNPFAVQELGSGYMVASSHMGEGKCGEAKCGAEAHADSAHGDKVGAEGKCGEGKCGGEKHAKEAHEAGSKTGGEGKCGEGKCANG